MEMTHQALRLYDEINQRLYLNQTERLRFHAVACTRPREVRAFALTLLYTGCRISEACTMKSAALQAQARSLSIMCLKKRSLGIVREVPIPTELVDALAQISSTAEDYLWGSGSSPFPRISAYRWIKSIMAEADLDGAHACPKGIRHGYGVNATSSGVLLHMLQRWRGHSSIKTTAIYATVVGPDEQRLAELMW